jgi:hypothetical protein
MGFDDRLHDIQPGVGEAVLITVGELQFRTRQAVLNEMFDSAEGQSKIMQDTFRFMSHERSTTLPSTEWLL